MGQNGKKHFFAQFFGGNAPKKPTFTHLGQSRYRLSKPGRFKYQMMRDIYATGYPAEMWDTLPYRLKPGEDIRDVAQKTWIRSRARGATVYMDSADLQRRTGIAKRNPNDYDAVKRLVEHRGLIPNGTHTFESLASGPLKGKMKIIGDHDRRTSIIARNDTAKAGDLYTSTIFAPAWSSNRGLMGAIGSYRSYLPTDSFIYKGDDGIYIRSYQKLTLDDFDYSSNNWIAGIYNKFSRELGKTVDIDANGQGYLRELFIPANRNHAFDLNNSGWVDNRRSNTVKRGREIAAIRERVAQGM